MTIEVGDKFPAIIIQTIDDEGKPAPVDTGDLTAGKTLVIFGVPGAFTPTCSVKHLPGFVAHADALLAAGADMIACHSVNDAFVMGAWAKANSAEKLTMLADGTASLTKALGLELDLTMAGMGLRCERYAMIVKDGVVAHLAVEPPQEFGVSSAEAILEAL